MKQLKHLLILSVLLTSIACSDWLDGAQPKDQTLDEQQYASEAGIMSMLNGMYRTMTSANLYGAKLTQTSVELLAHYYYYPSDLSNNNAKYTRFMLVSDYSANELQGEFAGTWADAYKLIFRLNSFVKNVEASQGILSPARKNMLLGEAYAMRALLHFDLYRLFGDDTRGIPYNRSTDVEPQQSKDKTEFYNLLYEDIYNAIDLLVEDPLRTDGAIKDLTNPPSDLQRPDIFFNYLRNYRLNYFAVQALLARALMYNGKTQQAAEQAQKVIDQSFGDGKPFNWVNRGTIENSSAMNYIFYSEVIFGLYNMDIYTTWKNNTEGTMPGETFAVSGRNLKENIFQFDNNGSDMSLWEDVRVKQWRSSDVEPDMWVSKKFKEFAYAQGDNPIRYLQPMMRMTEMFYIIVEDLITKGQYARAMEMLNGIRTRRGVQEESLHAPASATQTLVNDLLETEYYKEFYGEGQTFFYHKRRGSNRVFDVRQRGKVDVSPDKFTVPLPQSETDN